MFSIPASGIFSTLNESSSIETIRHLSPLSTIGSFLVLTDPKLPRRIHPKSTYTIYDDDINHRLSLRLINKAFAKWTIKWVFQRLTFREFVSDIREIKFQNIRHLLEIAATHSTKVLDFTGCRNLTDAVALVGIERAPKIVDLQLTQCKILSDAIFRLAVSKLRKLERLFCGNCEKLSGRGLQLCITSKRFPSSRLRELRIPSLKYMDDTIMNEICKAIGVGLEILDCRSTRLGDDTLRCIRRYNPNMKRLIAGFNDFTDEGIIEMNDSHVTRYPMLSLVELDVSNSFGVGDYGVLSICSSYANTLENLIISNLDDRFSVRCLHTVTQTLVKLKLLDLRFCSLIRPSTIKSLIYIQDVPPEIM